MDKTVIRDVGQLMEDEDLVAKEQGIDQDCHEGGLVNRIHLDSSTHHDSQQRKRDDGPVMKQDVKSGVGRGLDGYVIRADEGGEADETKIFCSDTKVDVGRSKKRLKNKESIRHPNLRNPRNQHLEQSMVEEKREWEMWLPSIKFQEGAQGGCGVSLEGHLDSGGSSTQRLLPLFGWQLKGRS
ncbi:hypothetical protein Acr_15g0014220 [Actinidia rufa]|uniref:Uncharacterized protein n=1 Tax=Actinidia rufa TaxID=165716 RepID=A0A7J0FW51_9ERIC|nr:hypothetical protein Acr_15g0014220 [Actinidia rufa]